MKKVLIILLVLGLLLIALVVGLVAFGISQIDNIFKAGIERGGTYATGVDTTVDTVDVSLTGGTFAMSGFELANPEGFSSPHFLSLSDTSVAINPNATSSETITLSTLTLDGISVYLDQGGAPSNYQAILNNLQRFESGSEPAPESESSGPKLVIESLIIENIDVHLANMPGVSLLAGDVAVNVPQIELQNVGGDEPMTFGEIVGLVVKTVLAASVEAGGGIIPVDVLGQLTGGLGSLESLQDMGIDAVGAFGEQLEGQIGNVTEQAEQVVEDAVEDLRQTGEDLQNQVEDAAGGLLNNLMGGNKEDEP
ncbi:MAG: hypothetical protein AAGA55_07725 [Planctomycetota bacterium]